MTKKANFIEPDILVDRLDSNYYASRFYDVERKIVSSSYVYKEFKEICKVVKCGPFGSSVLAENYATDGIAMVRPLNLKEILLADDDLVRFPEKDLPSNAPMFHADDILFARVGMPSCSIVTKAIGTVTISPNIIAAKIKDNVDKHYVTTFLNTNYGINQIERRFKAVSQPTISTEDVKTLKIVLPSLDIQQYIGSKIRKAEELREEAKLLWLQADEIFRKHVDFDLSMTESAGFQLLVEDPVAVRVSPANISERLTANSYNLEFLSISALKNSNKIKFCKLNHLAEISAMIGWKNLTTNDYVLEDGVYLLRVQDIKNGYVEITGKTVMACADKVKEQPQIQLEKSDIVFSKDGSLGFAAVISENLNKYQMCAGSTLARIRIKEAIDPYYLSFVLNSNVIKAQISYFLSGIAQPHINQEFIKLLEVPMLSPELQSMIGGRLKLHEDSILKGCELIAEAKQDIEDLIEGKFNHSKITETV